MQNKVYHNVEQITGNVIVVKADDVIAGELAQVESEFGTSLAQVFDLKMRKPFYRYCRRAWRSTDAKVRFLSRTMQVLFLKTYLDVFFRFWKPKDNGPESLKI